MQSPAHFSPFSTPLTDALNAFTERQSAGRRVHFPEASAEARAQDNAGPTEVADVTSQQCRSLQYDDGPVPSAYSDAELARPLSVYTTQSKSWFNDGNLALMSHFLAPQNVNRIMQTVRGRLSSAVEMPVHLPLDDEIVGEFVELAQSNTGLAPTQQSLDKLSHTVTERLTTDRFYGLRQRKLYQRYYIDQDRIRVMPRGEYMVHQRGDVQIDTSGQMLSHPFKARQAQYLQDVMFKPRRNPFTP